MPETPIWDRVIKERDGTQSKDLQLFTAVRRSEEEHSQRRDSPTSPGYLTDQSVIRAAGNYPTPFKQALYLHVQCSFAYLAPCQSLDGSGNGTVAEKQKTA